VSDTSGVLLEHPDYLQQLQSCTGLYHNYTFHTCGHNKECVTSKSHLLNVSYKVTTWGHRHSLEDNKCLRDLWFT
jgi:hypothetical protein